MHGRPKTTLPWLRKTEYLDQAETLPTHKAGLADRKAPTSLDADEELTTYDDVLRSFEAVKTPPKTHPTKVSRGRARRTAAHSRRRRR